MVTVGCLLAFFYNVVVSWAIWYAGVSILGLLGDKLAWTSCSHDFNSKMCVVDLDQAAVGCADVPRESSNESSCRVTSSVEEYWERNVLGHVGYDWENFVGQIYFILTISDNLLYCRANQDLTVSWLWVLPGSW